MLHTGSDRLHGQAGNDYLSAGYGFDRLYGGDGRDFLDASAAGKVARLIDGGTGRDRARCQPSERHDVRRVEIRRIMQQIGAA